MNEKDTVELSEKTKAAASAVHNRYVADATELWKQTNSIGTAALRAPLAINGGGVAVTLAFVSSNSETLRDHVGLVTLVFFSFMIGTLLSALAPASAWLAMAMGMKSGEKAVLQWKEPYVIEDTNSGYFWSNKFLFWLTSILGIAGYFLFVIGSYSAFEMVKILLCKP